MGLHNYASNPPCCRQDGVLYCPRTSTSALPPPTTPPPPSLRPAICLDTSYLESPKLRATASVPIAQNADTRPGRYSKDDFQQFKFSRRLTRTPSLSSEEDANDCYRESDETKFIVIEGNRWQCQACHSNTAREIDIRRHIQQVHFRM